MSNSLAVAAVTSSLRYVLERAQDAPHAGKVGGATVTTLHPSSLTTSDLAGAAGINVFCFLATPNHAWNLNDLPTRRSDGSLTAGRSPPSTCTTWSRATATTARWCRSGCWAGRWWR